MNHSQNRLYELLPQIYRQRDAELGYPLKGLLQVMAEQVEVVENDITQLYENWFIETCQPWAIPYIGDLIGYRPGLNLDRSDLAGFESLSTLTRREVANTIRYRRRKGSLALLEELAWTVTGWPARAVEFYRFLAQTQSVKFVRLERGQTVDLRRGQVLRQLNTPFDELAHRVDVRRINSSYSQGRYNLPNLGLFVWRTRSYSLTQAPAYNLEDLASHFYTFSILGNDTPLYQSVSAAEPPLNGTNPGQLPGVITRQAFEADKSRFYGPGKSLHLWAGRNRSPIPVEAIVVTDLSDWGRYRPARGQVAIDPQLGRILFHNREAPKQGLWVSYHYGFAADIGGGEYERPLEQPATPYYYYRVGAYEIHKTLEAALSQWAKDEKEETRNYGLIEITDNQAYEPANINLAENQTLQLRAAQGTRPVIYQTDQTPNAADALTVTLAAGSRFSLDGLLITGRGLRLQGPSPEDPEGQPWGQPTPEPTASPLPRWVTPAEICIRHTTLTPGWTLLPDCEPGFSNESSLILENIPAGRVKIECSILGSILVSQDEVMAEPIPIHLSDSILDATRPEYDALSAGWVSTDEDEPPSFRLAHALFTSVASTIFGQIHTHAIDLAENTIFNNLVRVGRRQRGCIRFCYVPPGSRTPRRYHCQPDLVEQAVREKYAGKMAKLIQEGFAQKQQDKLEQEKKLKLEQEALRVQPQFKNVRYGTPTYAQLAETCALEISRGASDESEMGVFHHLYNPQREANLRARLAEYVPAGAEVGLFIVD